MRWVSIPLKSGHWFNSPVALNRAPAVGLNPFEIRALVQYGYWQTGRRAKRLNPFEIRALVQ